MWRDYFPNAAVYGADVDKDILFETERIKLLCKSIRERSHNKMWDEIKEDNFDIIIDDGLHTLNAGICMFDSPFEKLRENGIYIIEDVDPYYLHELSAYLGKKHNIEIVTLKSKIKNS